MQSENPTGCIYPSCKCRFRCKDLFETDAAIIVVGGICPSCKKSTTLYNFSTDFICKNCIADKLFSFQNNNSTDRMIIISELDFR